LFYSSVWSCYLVTFTTTYHVLDLVRVQFYRYHHVPHRSRFGYLPTFLFFYHLSLPATTFVLPHTCRTLDFRFLGSWFTVPTTTTVHSTYATFLWILPVLLPDSYLVWILDTATAPFTCRSFLPLPPLLQFFYTWIRSTFFATPFPTIPFTHLPFCSWFTTALQLHHTTTTTTATRTTTPGYRFTTCWILLRSPFTYHCVYVHTTFVLVLYVLHHCHRSHHLPYVLRS